MHALKESASFRGGRVLARELRPGPSGGTLGVKKATALSLMAKAQEANLDGKGLSCGDITDF